MKMISVNHKKEVSFFNSRRKKRKRMFAEFLIIIPTMNIFLALIMIQALFSAPDTF